MTEQKAFDMEVLLIKQIGMKKDNGPLTNLYEGGCGASKSEETKRKISIAKKLLFASGKPTPPMLGKKHSLKTREKMRLNHSHKKWSSEAKAKLKIIRNMIKPSNTMSWRIVSPNGMEFIVWGLGEFCRKHGLSQSHMFAIANGTRPHHKGWKCYRNQPL